MNLWWVFHFTPVVFGVVYILLGRVSQNPDFYNLEIVFFRQSASSCVEKSHPMTSAGGLQRQPTASFDLTD